MAEESTDLTTLGDITGTLERPKNLDMTDRTGADGFTMDEIQLPRLAIAQGLSPQILPGDPKYIQGLVIGQMFNDVTGEIYGAGPLMVVPITRHVTRIEFDPNDRKVVLDREVPPGDPRLKWTKDAAGNGVPPAATEFVEFVSLLLRKGREPEKLVVSIKTTNKEMRSAAKLWTTHIGLRGTAIYTGIYSLTSQVIRGKNRKGQETAYGVFVERNAGFIPTDTPAGAALLAYAKKFAEELKGKTIVTEREADDPDAFDPAAMENTAPSGAGDATDM